MKLASCVLKFVAISTICSPVFAADPTTIMGKWIEKISNGKGIVTEFSTSSMSYYPVDDTGKPVAPTNTMAASYKDLGGQTIAVTFDGGAGIMVLKNTDTSITLDFPGLGVRQLTKIPQ